MPIGAIFVGTSSILNIYFSGIAQFALQNSLFRLIAVRNKSATSNFLFSDSFSHVSNIFSGQDSSMLKNNAALSTMVFQGLLLIQGVPLVLAWDSS